MHEIKTPLTAIIGFAEIIDGEMFGPAGERYRGRAGEIVSEARRLKALEDENRRLKHLVADLTLDNQALKALSAKKW